MNSDSMNNLVPDYRQRQQAISPEKSFIVRAPAGSGKTELLIQRYLKLLSLVDYPEEIIAITFTRKAAAEMQDRVLAALERAEKNIPSKNDATRLTDEIAVKVLAQDQKQHWQLLQNPGRMRIQTIDSLSAWLTRQLPILSGLGAQPVIVDDATEMYQQAAVDTLMELDGSENNTEVISELLSHLDNNVPKLKSLLAGMLAKRDQWLRHVTREVCRDDIESALRHIVESHLEQTRSVFPKEHEIEFLECLRFAAENLVSENSQSPVLTCHGIDHLPGTTAIELPRWQAVAEFCLTQKKEWRKSPNKNQGFPATTAGRNMKKRFATLLACLSDYPNLLYQLQNVQQLPPVSYSVNEWRIINALFRLLILANDKLQIIFSKNNQIDFTGITGAAISALNQEESPTDLALYLDYKIKHILIDEFQDVSINQFQLIRQLTAGWSPGDGHTLFLVGDPMQSIYRFREAEVGLFIETWNSQRLDQVPLEALQINVNFRSQAGVVEWINQSFRQILPEKSDAVPGAVSYEQSEVFHKVNVQDAVQVHAMIHRDDENEAQQVISLVQTTLENDPDGKIAILVRNRTHLINIVSRFKQSKIPFRAVDIDALGRRPAIQDLLALTMALHHSADRISWLAVLRAPWCGLDLKDLLALAGHQSQRTVWECLQDNECLRMLSTDGQQRALKIRAIVQICMDRKGRDSLRRSIERVWVSLGGPATLVNASDLVNTRTFFELLEEFDSGSELKQREEFIERVGNLYATPDVNADDQIQIMTIHKAKGLEFDTVILPGLHRVGKSDDPQLLLWTESPHGMHQDLLLAPIREAGQENSPIYEYISRLEKQKKLFEAGRLLYVATTRARKSLHLLGAVNVNQKGEMNKPNSASLLAQLWPAVACQFEMKFSGHEEIGINQDITGSVRTGNLLFRLPHDWLLPKIAEGVIWKQEGTLSETPDTLPEFEWAGETIKHIGTVVHTCIQRMAVQGLEVWDEKYIATRQSLFELLLRRLGVEDSNLQWATQQVSEALLNMIHDEYGRWILDKHHIDAHNEYRISGSYKGVIVNAIIDRTFIENGTRWIIDYKTSRHEGQDMDTFLDREQERYKPQLEKYKELVKSLDDKPVKLGLYFPLLQRWRVVI